ncbi:MAG: MFS transporter, partial [Spirochaetaceae bacterium]
MIYITDAKIEKGKRALLISIALFVCAIIAIVLLLPNAIWPPFSSSLPLEYPVYAHKGDNDQLFVIDSSLRRIVSLSADGELSFALNGGSREDQSFFYAKEISSLDDGSFLVLNNRLDEKGFYLTHEEIQLYNSHGEYEKTLVRREYTEKDFSATLVQRGRISDIKMIDDTLWWYETSKEGISNYSYSFSEDVITKNNEMAFADADLHIASTHRLNADTFLAVLKDGSIGYGDFLGRGRNLSLLPKTSLDGSPNMASSLPDSSYFRVLFRHQKSSEPDNLGVIPWSIGLTQQGLVFTDLENQSIQRLDQNGELQEILNVDILSQTAGEEVYPYYYYSLTTRIDGTVITTNDEGVVILDPTNEIHFIGSAEYSSMQRLLGWLFWISSLVALVSLLIGIRGFFYGVMKGRLSPVLTRALGLAVLILLIGGLSSLIIIPNFSGRYQDVVLQRISQMLQLIPHVIDADAMATMDSPEDYNSPEYQKIRSRLMDAFNQNQDDWNRGYYFALYRIINGKLYGFMYMNGQINPYHPFDWLMGEEDPGVYDLAWQGEIATELVTDISGDWIYGVGPIYDNDGEIIGLFETGTDLYALQYENSQLIKNLILELLVFLIVIILLVVELTFFNHIMEKRRDTLSAQATGIQSEESGDFSGILFTRPLAYLFFTGLSLSVAFLPILSSRLYVAEPGQASAVIIALPLAVETFGFGLATLLAGFLVAVLSWKGLFYGGVLLAGAGLYLSGAADSHQLLTIARAITGVGSGFAYMGLRSIINREKDPAKRTKGFANFYAGMTAGINTGLVIGASLADGIGLQKVFFVASAVMLAVFFFPILIRIDDCIPALEKIKKRMSAWQGLGTFLGSPRIWLFFITLILPTYIAGAFIVYYFPLFAETQGLNTADIGRLLILNGLCIVYFGPALSSFIEKRTGNTYGSVIGSF